MDETEWASIRARLGRHSTPLQVKRIKRDADRAARHEQKRAEREQRREEAQLIKFPGPKEPEKE
jgi:hypothetical protein